MRGWSKLPRPDARAKSRFQQSESCCQGFSDNFVEHCLLHFLTTLPLFAYNEIISSFCEYISIQITKCGFEGDIVVLAKGGLLPLAFYAVEHFRVNLWRLKILTPTNLNPQVAYHGHKLLYFIYPRCCYICFCTIVWHWTKKATGLIGRGWLGMGSVGVPGIKIDPNHQVLLRGWKRIFSKERAAAKGFLSSGAFSWEPCCIFSPCESNRNDCVHS